MKAFSLVGECVEKSELVRHLVVERVRRGLGVSTIKRLADAFDPSGRGMARGSIASPALRK